MNKQFEMYKRIEDHGKNLLRIFPEATEKDAIKLCKKLFRLERKANNLATDYCNGIINTDEWPELTRPILKKVNDILGNKTVPIFINGDARGYALKIEDSYVRKHGLYIQRDMGGHGLIAPDLREE